MRLVRLAGVFSVMSLARIGYVAKGLVFLAIGILAMLALFGFAEGRLTGSGGAIHMLGGRAPGRIGFTLLVIGLGAHVFWRLYQAVIDPDGRGTSLLGLIQRGGFVISAALYGSMMLVALSALTGLGSNGEQWQSIGAGMADHAMGRVGLGLIGLGLLLAALYQLYRAWIQPYRQRWKHLHAHRLVKTALAWLSAYGIAVRSGIFLLMGWQLLRAGWFAAAEEILDVATALWVISREDWGEWGLGLVATGLASYGVYCLFNAAFREIDPVPDKQDALQ